MKRRYVRYSGLLLGTHELDNNIFPYLTVRNITWMRMRPLCTQLSSGDFEMFLSPPARSQLEQL